MRIRHVSAVSAVLLAAAPILCAAPPARETWLPPAVEDGAARQLGARMTEIGIGGPDAAQTLEGARRAVDAMATQIETMGEEGILQTAPEFPKLSLPSAGQRHLDAMAGKVKQAHTALAQLPAKTYNFILHRSLIGIHLQGNCKTQLFQGFCDISGIIGRVSNL